MTENLLQKLEERMINMLSEIEGMRKEVARLTQENASLKNERESSTKKLFDLVSLLDTVSAAEEVAIN